MGAKLEVAENAIGCVPRCKQCGSERVVKNAWACFNPPSGLWELETVLDRQHCHQCDGETTFVWHHSVQPPQGRITELNDQFRRHGQGNGSVMITVGVQAGGEEFMRAVIDAVRTFDGFSDDNDPWGEHDFGALEVKGERIFFKLDYYDPTCSHGSENPANAAVTHRVLTIMLANEY